MKKMLTVVFTIYLATTLWPIAADAAILYGLAGSEENVGDVGMLYRIDTVAQTVTAVGNDPARDSSGPEIQLNPTGTAIYMSQANDDMFLINPATGLNTGSLSLSGFPDSTNTVTAMEFVENTLYGSFHQSGPESNDGILGTINTSTGAITEIGAMTGMNRPTGGLSYVNGVMYAVSSTDNNDSRLFTVNLVNGAATLIGNLTLNSVQQQSASALTYADGKLYTVLYGQSTNLFSINPATGELTVEFDTGVSLNSLTTALNSSSASIPTLSEWGMVLMIILIGGVSLYVFRKNAMAA